MGLVISLSNPYVNYYVKSQFYYDKKDNYNMFESIEKQLIMYQILSKEIDFHDLEETGIIESHFPMHKCNSMDWIQKSLDHYKFKLMYGFVFGGFRKYMQPLNIIKLYYGEKYAFEYAFLIHYQAWLCIPSILGLMLYFFQLDRFRRLDIDMKTAYDSPLNGIFGIFVAIWATLFVESWKRK